MTEKRSTWITPRPPPPTAVARTMLPYFDVEYANLEPVPRRGARTRRWTRPGAPWPALGARPAGWSLPAAARATTSPCAAALARRGGEPHHPTVEHAAVLPLRCSSRSSASGDVPARGRPGGWTRRRRRAITPSTVLVSVMYAGCEVGTIEPIAEIARGPRPGVIAHRCGAGRRQLDLDVERLGVNHQSSRAQFYAPKGVGALYVRQGTPILPPRRAGARSAACGRAPRTCPHRGDGGREIATTEREAEAARLALRDRLLVGLMAAVPDARVTGHPTERLPNNASLAFRGIEGVAPLAARYGGVRASTGSPAPLTTGASRLTALGLVVVGTVVAAHVRPREHVEDIDHVLRVLRPSWRRCAHVPLYTA